GWRERHETGTDAGRTRIFPVGRSGRHRMTGIREALGLLWSASDDAKMVQQGKTWSTWGEVRSLAEKVDAELTRVGCSEGARIGVVLGNRVESVASLIAILGKGRTIITLNPMQPPARVTADV